MVESYSAIFRTRGGRVVFAELEATQTERLRRNETEFRLAEKPFKRDLIQSRKQPLELDAPDAIQLVKDQEHRTTEDTEDTEDTEVGKSPPP